MEVFIIVAVIIVGIIIQHILRLKNVKDNRMEKEQENEKVQENEKENETRQIETEPDTLGLMFNTLNELGCQPTKNDDETISVRYQGENFQMEFGGMYCSVWDPMWFVIKVDDPNLPNVKEAVNIANFNFGPTVVMTHPNDEGHIWLHSRSDILLHPACPDNVAYVKAVLDSFFTAKDNVRNQIRQLNAQQMEDRKKRRPVGFTIDSTNSQTEE